jgi:3-oxoacyl-(acyl-carrier-protein) synthase III
MTDSPNTMPRIYSRIIGTGSHLPARVLTNAELEKQIETTSEWILERTGIRERHIAAEGELTSDLAQQAAEKAIDAAGIDAGEIELIVVATTTPDRVFPSTACAMQAKLGITNSCPAFDVQAVCSGFVYAVFRGGSIHPFRSGEDRPGRGRGNSVAHHRLERPGQLHAVGRRRWRRGPAGI